MSSRKLKAGAKAGIGIGAALGVAILLGLVFIIFRRRQKSDSSPESKTDTYDKEHNAELPAIQEERLPEQRVIEPDSKLHEVSLPEIGSVASFGVLPGLRRKTPVPEPMLLESNVEALADRKTKASSVSTHQEALKALKALNISASPPPSSTTTAKDGPSNTAANSHPSQ